MKKLLVFAVIALLAGCGNKQDKEKIMDEYAKTYYNNHMIMIASDEVVITKEMLLEASDEDDYDMSKLEGCSNSSKVIFEIEDRQIKNTEYILECE